MKEDKEVGTDMVPAESGEISGLMKLALEGNHPVEVLERLVTLQERVTDRMARMAYIEALSGFREECPQPKRTKENPQFSVTRGGVKRSVMYSPLDEIERTARPVAAKYGLTWTWDTRVDDELMHITCKVQHVEGHSDSATVSMPYESKAGSSPQQKYGSTQTYGMRYSLVAALGITTADEDVDGADGENYINESQLADLRAKIGEVGATEARICKTYGLADLNALPSHLLSPVIDALEEKARKASR